MRGRHLHSVRCTPMPDAVHPTCARDDMSRGRGYRPTIGSPPRMWGRRPLDPGLGPLTRFTPTHVGTTLAPLPTHYHIPGHPHACGDDVSGHNPSARPPGSPPRMWGRLACVVFHLPLVRFTPTHVGTTQSTAPPGREPSVHPHACGDDHEVGRLAVDQTGSPHACGD